MTTDPGRHRAHTPRTSSSVSPTVRRLIATFSSLLLVATAASGGAVYALNSLNGNITTIDTSDLGTAKPTPRPPSDTSAINFLVMGSDTRAGQGAGFGSASGARSDTTLLVHLYKGRTKAVVVSIPRDSEVTIPPCTMNNGNKSTYWTTKFNAAFSIGGPVCTIKTIQSTTGLNVDKFVVVDFNAVKKITDVLGGVRVCFTTPVYDPYVPGRGGSGLNLPAGYSTISGKQALAFVRARETLGDGSDLGRIQRQQEFLSSMMQGIESRGVLTSPSTVYQILSAITSSISTSADLANVQAMSDFALSLVNLKPKNITFVTTPYTLKGDGNVHWTSETERMWKALQNEQEWPPAKSSTASAEPSVSPSGSPTTSVTIDPAAAALVTAPSDVHVNVVNGTLTTGLGGKVASKLRKQGFIVGSTTTAKTQVFATEIHYNSKFKTAAQTLAYAMQNAVLVKDNSLTKYLTVVIGPDYTSVRKVVLPEPSASATPGVVNGATVACSAGNNKVKTK